MSPKHYIDITVRFTFEGKEYEGVIQGLKESTGKANGDQETVYWVWTGDRGQWVRESGMLARN